MTDQGLTEPLLNNQCDKIQVGEEIEGSTTLFILTRSGNLLNYSEGKLTLWSLLSKKIVHSEELKGITVIYESPKGTNLFIGYNNGTLESRDPNTQQVLQQIYLKSGVKALKSDEKNLYVSLRNGKVLQFPSKNISRSSQKIIRSIDRGQPITHLKLSRDETFLIGYVDIDQVEMLFIYNTIKSEESWQTKLDLSPGVLREDPNKLFVISEDCLNIFIRGENNKGVCMFSLFDGSVVQNMTSMHTNYINEIVVTKDSKKVITCSRDRKIKIWDWIQQECLATMILHEDSVESIVLSDDETLLFSGSHDKIVNIWSMHDYLFLAKLQTKLQIRSLHLSDDNDILLASSKDHPIQAYWILEDNADALRIRVELKNVSNCYVTPNNEFLVTMIGNSSLKIWNLKSRQLIESHKINCEFAYNLRALNGTRDSEYIFFQKEQSELLQWSCSQQQQIHTFNHVGQVQDVVITKDDKIMYTLIYRNIYKWDLQSKQELLRFSKEDGYYLYLILSHDEQRLYANVLGPHIYEYDLSLDENQEYKKLDILNDAGWLYYELSPDGFTVIQTNQYNGSFWVCNIIEGKILRILNKHSERLNFVGFTKDGKYLITRSKSESIIWETTDWKVLITIQEEFGVVTSSSRYVQAIIHDGLYKQWSDQILSSFSDDYAITSTEQGEKVTQTAQEVNESDIKITGKFNNLMKIFIGNVGKKNLDEKKYLPFLYKSQIQPFKTTLVHFYAYYNQAEFVKKLLRMGSPFIEDYNENTPLDYAIQKRSYETATIILEYFMKRSHLYDKLSEEKLIKLIKFAPSNLKEFFDSSVKEQVAQYLPSFGTFVSDPIKYHNSQTNFITVSDAKNMILEVKGNDEPLVFKSIQIQFNMQPGSISSINFHRTLSECELSAFRSETVQALLAYKWDLIKKIVFTNGLIYLLYMLVLFAFIQTYNEIYLYFLIAFGLYFMCFEILQIYLNQLKYLSDFWNLFDFFRVLFLVIFIFKAFCQEEWYKSQSMLQLLSALNFLSWVRALSFLRLIQKTRIFIRLLEQVIYDMIPFMIVLIGAVLGISLSFEVLNNISLVDALKHNYRLTFGDFDTDNYTNANWFLFIIGSVLIPLIMLNMLVAIMSDTYARVMSDILPSDFHELNQMILEQEEIQFWNRKKGKSGFLHYVTPLLKKEGNDWEGQIQKIITMLQQQNGQSPQVLNKTSDKIDLIIESQKIQLRDTTLKFDEQKKRFDRIQQELDVIIPKQKKEKSLQEEEEEEDSDAEFFDEDYLKEQLINSQTFFQETSIDVKAFVNRSWFKYHPNKSGKLNKQDSLRAIKDFYQQIDDLTLDESQIEEVFQKTDLNGDQLLTKTEIYLMLMRLLGLNEEVEVEISLINQRKCPKDAFTRFLEPQQREIFEKIWIKYDSDKKGYIDSSSGTQLIKEYSKRTLSYEDLANLLKSLDKDSDGRISKEELQNFIAENKYLLNEY